MIVNYIDRLEYNFQKKVKLFLIEARLKYPNLYVYETLRTYKRQKHLYWIGRTHSFHRNPITWTMKSKHREGKALDIIFKKWTKLNRSWPYSWLHKIAKKYWIVWIVREQCHFQDDWTLLNFKYRLMPEYKKILDDLIEKWYTPVFTNYEWEDWLYKILIEIWLARKELQE